MKTIHTVTKPTQFPQFWDEEWLKVAIDELDSRKMTPDEKASLEMLIARNAEAVKAESRRIRAAKEEGIEEGIEKGREAEKIETILNALSMGLSVEQSAKLANVSADFVKAVQQKLSAR
jgi:predicted transposase/invertase (TIGR01784 family)